MTDYNKKTKSEIINELLDYKEKAQNLFDSKEELQKQLDLHVVGCSVILKEINKQIDKYYEDHKHCNIVTCDLGDVYKWLRKAEKKAKKKLRKK